MRKHRPKVLVNMSMTADGKIASENRRISSFGSPADLDHLYELRSKVDAILCGARTIDSNHVGLGNGPGKHGAARLQAGLAPWPIRVIATARGSLDPQAFLFGKEYGPIIVLTTIVAAEADLSRFRTKGAEVYQDSSANLDFVKALNWLHKQKGVRTLLCEGGGVLNDALFQAGLVDELHLTICPFILGGSKAPTIADGHGALSLLEAKGFRVKQFRPLGQELFLVLRPIRSKKTACQPRPA